MSSVSSSLLGAMGLDDAAEEFLLGELSLLTPNAFLGELPEVGVAPAGDGDADATLNDGNDELLSRTMSEFLGDIELRQRKQPVKETASKLESLLTMPPPSNVRRNKRAFREAAVRSHQPSKKAKGKGKLTPNVIIEIPDDVSPPKSATVDITTDRPLSPIIGGGQRRRLAAKPVKKQKGVNVETASTSLSSSSTQAGSSGLAVSGGGALVEPASATSTHSDWGEFSTSQQDIFSRAFEQRSAIHKALDDECRTLENREKELLELRQKQLELQQKVQGVENGIEESKTVDRM